MGSFSDSDWGSAGEFIVQRIDAFLERAKGELFASLKVQVIQAGKVSFPHSVGKGSGDIVITDDAIINQHEIVVRDGVIVHSDDCYSLHLKGLIESGEVFIRFIAEFDEKVEATPC